MAAGKANYLIVWEKSAQVYSATSIKTALNTPIPKGCEEEDKHILFLSYLPDEELLKVYPLTDEQIEKARAEVQQKEKEDEQE
jgi:hypothetical protein